MSPKNMPQSRARRRSERRFLLWGGLGLLVFAAVVIGLAISSGDDVEADEFETGFAEAIGPALPRYDGSAVGVGAPAPDIRTHTTEVDTEVYFEMDDGTVRVVEFFAHWCQFCRRELPRQSSWLLDNGGPEGVEILAISTSVDSGAPNHPPAAWFNREEWPLPVYVDSENGAVATGYGLATFPYYVLVDGDGIVVERGSGELSENEFAALIDRAAAARPA